MSFIKWRVATAEDLAAKFGWTASCKAYGIDLATDYSPSENDDKTDTVAAHHSKYGMKSAQGNKASTQAMPSAGIPPVAQTAEVTCHVSVTIPKTLQPLKVCKAQLNGIHVAQPSKDAAVLSNRCAIPTAVQPTPAPVHPSLAVSVKVVSSMEQSLAYVTQFLS
ncbi:hypothetical protein MRX96_002326 [Rhipicephalus microplus]